MKKFIVIEGGEGSGKSTLVNLLKQKYSDEFVFTREPGGSQLAESIRDLALNNPLAKLASAETQFSLMWAGRHDNLVNTIIPALENGKNVLCDRFDSATFAYQIYGMEAKNLEPLFWEIRKVFLKNRLPDLYILLDVEPKVGLERVALRKEKTNHFDERAIDFHTKIREGFFNFKENVPNCVVINANRPLEQVKQEFFEIIDKECFG